MCLAPNDLLISGNRPPSRTEDVSVPEADSDQGQVTSWSRSSKNMGTSSTWVRHQHKKPSEVFRTDFITAMKLPDSAQLGPDDFYVLSDPWRQEWEKGVQVPANLEAIPEPVVRSLPESTGGLSNNGQEREGDTRPPPTQLYSCYDLDDLDVAWLQIVNQEFRQMGLPELDELTMECVLVELESVCEEKMQQAIETEEGLGIEYDEDVVCDVCRSPEGEDGNEMVFCDKCNVCVHQACYGILKVPQGNWLCRTCALGVQPKCLLCPKRGGALKPTRSGTKWVHVSCALWIPEVSIGCPEKMEPITKVSHIPASRWALSCSLCREHTGTCIQCSMPSCIVAFHVTCAFDHGLEMKTILAENDEVRFKSFCLEHSNTSTNTNSTFSSSGLSNGNHVTASTANGAHGGARPEWAATGLTSELRQDQQNETNGSSDPEQRSVSHLVSVSASERAERDQLEREKVSQRKQKLQELEDEFYRLVEPREVAENLGLPVSQVDYLYQFWKLKRKANFNRPLVTLKRDEVDNLAQQEQDVLYRRLKLFTHLRQDLERVRNLCYMVTRREKMKHTLCDLQEKIFHLQIQLLEEDMAGEKTQKGEKRKQNGVKDKGKERRKNSPEKKKERWKSENGSMLKELAPAGRREFAQPNDGELHAVHLENTPVGAQTEREQQAPCSCTTNHSGPASDAPVCSCCVRWQQPSTAKRLWASVAEEKSGHVSRKGEKNKGSSKTVHHPLHHHQTRSSDLHRDPPPQPPISKMDSCHISEDNSPWDGIHAGNGVVSRAGSGFTVGSNPPVSGLGFTMPDAGTIFRGGTPRHRLSRQGKSRVRGVTRGVAGFESMDLPLAGKDVSLLDAAETDGYFSDGEQSDSDTRTGGRKLRLPQLHSGNEDLLRRSVLAS
uniref:Jade family PHD finger 2 n=1 Tax=Oreochromis niloticus TaxID=8128 RepID=I3KKZ3_ORENI